MLENKFKTYAYAHILEYYKDTPKLKTLGNIEETIKILKSYNYNINNEFIKKVESFIFSNFYLYRLQDVPTSEEIKPENLIVVISPEGHFIEEVYYVSHKLFPNSIPFNIIKNRNFTTLITWVINQILQNFLVDSPQELQILINKAIKDLKKVKYNEVAKSKNYFLAAFLISYFYISEGIKPPLDLLFSSIISEIKEDSKKVYLINLLPFSYIRMYFNKEVALPYIYERILFSFIDENILLSFKQFISVVYSHKGELVSVEIAGKRFQDPNLIKKIQALINKGIKFPIKRTFEEKESETNFIVRLSIANNDPYSFYKYLKITNKEPELLKYLSNVVFNVNPSLKDWEESFRVLNVEELSDLFIYKTLKNYITISSSLFENLLNKNKTNEIPYRRSLLFLERSLYYLLKNLSNYLKVSKIPKEDVLVILGDGRITFYFPQALVKNNTVLSSFIERSPKVSKLEGFFKTEMELTFLMDLLKNNLNLRKFFLPLFEEIEDLSYTSSKIKGNQLENQISNLENSVYQDYQISLKEVIESVIALETGGDEYSLSILNSTILPRVGDFKNLFITLPFYSNLNKLLSKETLLKILNEGLEEIIYTNKKIEELGFLEYNERENTFEKKDILKEKIEDALQF